MNKQTVSSMLRIEDSYTAFCIDEAAAFVMLKLKSGASPIKRDGNRKTAEMLKEGRW